MKRANRFDNRGFSLAEVMLTVAILVVLFALAMIPISKYQKEFRQQELDSKAEIIYMAAQSLSNQRFILFFLPFRVISIHPGNYKIYWFFFSPVHFFSHLQLKKCLRHSPVIYYIFLLPAFRFFFFGITLFFIYIPSYLLISIT